MLLRIENLTFGWQDETLFENISMNVSPGKIIILRGENGCGKSTLLHIITGMIPHFSQGHILKGDVLIENQSITHSSPKLFFPKIAYIPDKNSDYFLLTENLNEEIFLLQAILNLENNILKNRIAELIKHFPELEKLRQISFRQMKDYQKKLALLTIYYLQDATLFLLDEILKVFPLTENFRIINFLQTLSQLGKACLIVNHQEIDSFPIWEIKNKNLIQRK